MKRTEMKNELIKTIQKEIKEVENNIQYYRTMIEETSDISTKEMYEHSITYAKGLWYGLKHSISIIEAE